MIADLKKPLDTSIFKDKSVLITGGASGIGALTATQCAVHGAHVTVADINKEQGNAFVESMSQSGLRINFVPTDVSDWESQVKAFKAAIKYSNSNSIDVVVAGAGVAGIPFVENKDEAPSLEKDPPLPLRSAANFDVNAKGAYYTSKLAQHYFALPYLSPSSKDRRFRKCLVVISSLAGYLELNDVDYTASKWAVRGLFRSARSQMEDLGYRINLIAPWVMDTPMAKGLVDVCRRQGFPVGEPKSVADAVIRCAADDSICGRALGVGAEETFDLRDDIEGLNAGIVMKQYREGEAKNFMEFLGQRA
ncbi:hypothetical protein P7C71_g3692, partial [Lecanoromycetidae sp. Uapishka_2]